MTSGWNQLSGSLPQNIWRAASLGRTLAELGMDQLIVTGARTDACIHSTLHGAFIHGYDVTLVVTRKHQDLSE
ncbi:isochorismatase family protein [Streptomyces sp. NPDC051636]|uniref:isochorismatase family protein n=1 Tax=Streptomyces sp. NPDC051636 TaxID=3365663 RepID=UPI0037B723DA